MGKYIYQSHMGGIYACNEEQDYDFLYFEQCGDSDTLIGYAKDVQDAWELLKSETDTFDDSVCDNCEYKEDYDYCDEKCQEYANSGGYSLSYVMNFLHSEFPESDLWEQVYLIIQPKNHSEYLMTNCSVSGFEFGEKHSLPSGVCLRGENYHLVAKSLSNVSDDLCNNFSLLKTVKNNGITTHIYCCEADIRDNNNWSEGAHYCEDGWFAYFEKDALNLIDKDKFVLKNI